MTAMALIIRENHMATRKGSYTSLSKNTAPSAEHFSMKHHPLQLQCIISNPNTSCASSNQSGPIRSGQLAWELCFFSYGEFRNDVLEILEFFEKEFRKCRDELQTGQAISYSALTNLLPLILPLVLKVLRAVHALWISYAEDAMDTLPEELVEAARIMQNPAQISRLLVEIGEPQDTDDVAEFEKNDIGTIL
jgi:hypothetical protein